MIITASRRTDIPAFYGRWFIKRLREGYCTVVNPYNREQVSRISLRPEDVDVILFLTKNPKPFMPYLDELDSLGYRYYFHVTLNGYPKMIERNVPSLEEGTRAFRELADKLGPEKVVWRYDPILISNITGYGHHQARFAEIAQALAGSTHRVIISIADHYRKAVQQYKLLARQNILIEEVLETNDSFKDLMKSLADTSRRYGMEIFSCAEEYNLSSYGIKSGKCVDNEYIQRVFGIPVKEAKDKTQRSQCGCIVSRDIGVYDTCLHGCTYCYAGTWEGGQKKWPKHDPNSPSLLGHFQAEERNIRQLSLHDFLPL